MIAIIKYFIERLKDRMNKANAQISNLKEKTGEINPEIQRSTQCKKEL